MHVLICEIILIGVYFSSVVYAQDRPEFSDIIHPEIKRIGETGSLNCTVVRQGNNKVWWIQKDIDTLLTVDDTVYLEDRLNKYVDGGYRKYEVEMVAEGESKTYSLIIRQLEQIDAGNYTCLIQIEGEQQHPSKDGEIVVLYPPSIELHKTPEAVTQQENLDVNLTCSAQGYPKPNITWMRPSGKGLPKPFNDKFSVMAEILQLKNLTKTDRGVYRCIANNSEPPPAMYDITLYVQFAPDAIAVQSTYVQESDRLFDILLECRISGFPDPELRWYKKLADGLHPVADDDKHVIKVLTHHAHGQTLSMSEFWFQLTIKNVQANDYGDYICEGSNSLGTGNATVTLSEPVDTTTESHAHDKTEEITMITTEAESFFTTDEISLNRTPQVTIEPYVSKSNRLKSLNILITSLVLTLFTSLV